MILDVFRRYFYVMFSIYSSYFSVQVSSFLHFLNLRQNIFSIVLHIIISYLFYICCYIIVLIFLTVIYLCTFYQNKSSSLSQLMLLLWTSTLAISLYLLDIIVLPLLCNFVLVVYQTICRLLTRFCF